MPRDVLSITQVNDYIRTMMDGDALLWERCARNKNTSKIG